jgi:hypothetical protein
MYAWWWAGLRGGSASGGLRRTSRSHQCTVAGAANFPAFDAGGPFKTSVSGSTVTGALNRVAGCQVAGVSASGPCLLLIRAEP